MLSLKLRLSLALLAIVSLLGVVVATSYLTQRNMRDEVAVLCDRQQVDLRQVDFERNGLELEGSWDPGGVFIAREVELFPGRRRPKLRGVIQAVDSTRGSFTLYGQAISLSEELAREHLGQLAVGQRVEVTCDARDGVWTARELDLANIKASDKIKACPSEWDLDGIAPESVNIHGIQVSLIAISEPGVDSALHHLGTATALLLSLREVRTEAVRLVESHSNTASPDESSPERNLLNARADFEHYLKRTRPTDQASNSGVQPSQWVANLFEWIPELDRQVQSVVSASQQSVELGRAALRDEFTPFLEREIEPRLNAYLRAAQDDLGDRARSIESATRTTARIGLTIGVVATLAALLLGFLLWRSIRRPLGALESAAKRIAEGDLTARVEIPTQDEFGALADTFNQMSETLALTTVSIDNLQNILDSMGGSLILLSPDLRIKSVNLATANLLLFGPEELVGQPLSTICESLTAHELVTPGDAKTHVVERSLRRKDGSELAVSFSAAELRSGDGTLSGYVCVAHDLSEQKQVENQVRCSLEEKELLLREVHHRVKNNMQVISSLLAMQQSCATDPTVFDGLEQSQARIRSMALIHEHLYQSADLAEADVSAYLNLLISHISHSFGQAGVIELDLHIESIDLDLDHSLALGLIVNELLANSYRHAFESARTGSIRLSLRTIDGNQAELLVQDDGCGMDLSVTDKNPNTLGLSLVRSLVDQLGGLTEVAVNGGLTTRITFPCSRLTKIAS